MCTRSHNLIKNDSYQHTPSGGIFSIFHFYLFQRVNNEQLFRFRIFSYLYLLLSLSLSLSDLLLYHSFRWRINIFECSACIMECPNQHCDQRNHQYQIFDHQDRPEIKNKKLKQNNKIKRGKKIRKKTLTL